MFGNKAIQFENGTIVLFFPDIKHADVARSLRSHFGKAVGAGSFSTNVYDSASFVDLYGESISIGIRFSRQRLNMAAYKFRDVVHIHQKQWKFVMMQAADSESPELPPNYKYVGDTDLGIELDYMDLPVFSHPILRSE